VSGTNGDFLLRVAEVKADEVEDLERRGLAEAFERQAGAMPEPPAFFTSLRRPRRAYAVIGEIKRASPSAGDINVGLDPARQALAYERAGLAAVSVLNDATFFKGSPEHMLAAARATVLPVLCKDFVVAPVQVYRARAFGASAVLLIASLLNQPTLEMLTTLVRNVGLEPLVEVHDEDEVERAMRTDTRVIGVNARNLRTLEIDLEVSRRVIGAIPERYLRIAESGIHDRATMVELAELGYDAFLVGTYLSSARDLNAAVDALMEDGRGERSGEGGGSGPTA
jgi:indole-3-glycerol phosphate synthase